MNENDFNDETEISCCTYSSSDENIDYLTSLRIADQKAINIGKSIISLKEKLIDLQNTQEVTETTEKEINGLKIQLNKMLEKHESAVNKVLKLAKMINFDINDLKYRKIDVDQQKPTDSGKCASPSKRDDDLDGYIAPVIFINNETDQPKFMCYGRNNNGTTCAEDDNESSSTSTPTVECVHNDCINFNANNNNSSNCNIDEFRRCESVIKSVAVDYEKEAIKDNLMHMKGEMQLLSRQNRELFSQIENANNRTVAKSNLLDKKQSFHKQRVGRNVNLLDNVEKEPANTQTLLDEIDKLRNELIEVKRDRYQIELAKKVLNVADSENVKCVGSPTNICESANLITKYNKLLEDHDAKLLEIKNLQNVLCETKYNLKICEDNLTLANTQIEQLKKKLFDLTSDKSHDPEVASSNDKYLIESLKFRLQKAIDDKTNMELLFDSHLSELEDKKSKHMEILQINEELKLYIETLIKEKQTITKDFEVEFSRMNENLNTYMNQMETLPGILANTQQELETEISKRIMLQNERDALLNDINILNTSMACEGNPNDRNRINELEEENNELKAMLMTMENSMSENKRQYIERIHYSLQLKEHLDMVRQEAAIQVTKMKDFSECQKKKYVERIEKLEQMLAECRALGCSEFKKRNNINECLRNQIEVLTNNLNEADRKIEELLNAQHLMESKMGEELCKVPLTFKPSCTNFNFFNRPVTPDDN